MRVRHLSRGVEHRPAEKAGSSGRLCLPGQDLQEQLDARALGRAMDTFLDTISRENRVLFLRRYWFGDTIPEPAAEMGMKENAVTARPSRIRAKLKAYLIQEGFLYE